MVRSVKGMVVRRVLVVVLAAAAALVMGVLGPPVASASQAQTTPLEALAAEGAAVASSSPLCSAKQSHGKIIYQACIRFNCDATTCLVRTYMGIVNNATSSRSVDWGVQYDDQSPGGSSYDGGGRETLASGEQRTVFSPSTHRIPCNGWAEGRARVKYDSSGWSSWATTPVLFPAC